MTSPDHRPRATADAPLSLTNDEQSAIGRAFESPSSVFSALSTLRTRRMGLGYRSETPLLRRGLHPPFYSFFIVFPYFLFSGILIDRIYGFTDKCADKFPDIQFFKAGYLNDHPKVLETFAERVTEQIGEIPPPNCATCKYRTQILGFEAEVGLAQDDLALIRKTVGGQPCLRVLELDDRFDHCAILATSDCNYGRQHTLDDYPIVIAGSCNGALKTGLHYRAPSSTNTGRFALR